jgi:hypothetical protein
MSWWSITCEELGIITLAALHYLLSYLLWCLYAPRLWSNDDSHVSKAFLNLSRSSPLLLPLFSFYLFSPLFSSLICTLPYYYYYKYTTTTSTLLVLPLLLQVLLLVVTTTSTSSTSTNTSTTTTTTLPLPLPVLLLLVPTTTTTTNTNTTYIARILVWNTRPKLVLL